MKRVRNRSWIALAAMALAVSVGTSWYSSGKLEAARRRTVQIGYGSAALEGVKAEVSGASGEDRVREAERARAAREAEEKRIRAARKTAVDGYRASVEAEYEAFKRRVSERAAAFDGVRSTIPATVEKYGFKKCWSVMCALAKDKIAQTTGKGSATNFDELMNGDLRMGFYQPLQDARVEVLVLLNEFQVRLLACREGLDQILAKIPDWDRSLGEPPASLRAESLQIEEMMAALRGAQIGASTSAAFDAVCLVGVCQTVARLLAGAAARFAAGAAAGAATAMADSPAPGPADLVGLGIFGVGAAATVLEVRKAAKIVPMQLEKSMNETVDVQCAEVQCRTLDEGEKLYLTYARELDLIATDEG